MESPASLDPKGILAEAVRRTGLDDFGDPAFREPFERLLAAIAAEAGLHEQGRLAQRERAIGLLANRLRMEEAIRLHPEIPAEEIRDPIAIVGPGPTGTPMLP